jgi:hypothetical protein
MERLIYCSTARDDVDLQECRHIVALSQPNNARLGISGVLLFDSRNFVQWLEGPVNRIEPLYKRIARDPRHANLRLLLREPTQSRRFQRWSMALVAPTSAELREVAIAMRPSLAAHCPELPQMNAGLLGDLLIELLQRNYEVSSTVKL